MESGENSNKCCMYNAYSIFERDDLSITDKIAQLKKLSITAEEDVNSDKKLLNSKLDNINDNIKELQNKISDIYTMIKYAPGNIGYFEAKKEFESLRTLREPEAKEDR
jgi:hypothetical protein